MNATRFQLPPLPQPHYRFDEIPPAKRDFKGSSLQRVTDRTAWQACLGEMVLLCKEAVRRRRKKTGVHIPATSSKPLSLEYLADRSDVDDPLWGYMLRDQPQGRLQGFVTVTTFTNYHRSFRWDSLHPVAFDDEHHHHHVHDPGHQPAVDSNGRLAQELQATVRAGDIYQEGIVWPRIAEISLLGGLGCGRTLLALVLEDLQHAKASALAHYDYVVLQATENSVSFYESMGFIRVGALTTEASQAEQGMGSPRRQRQHGGAQHESGHDSLVQDWGSPLAAKHQHPKHVTLPPSSYPLEQPVPAASSGWIVGPATEEYTTKRPGETPLKIAQTLRVNAQDIVFLNLRNYPELTTTSRLKAQTVLIVPKILPKETARQRPTVEIQWYTAKENDTPRSIAKLFHVPCAQIVTANKSRLPGLMSSSRLKNGTKVRITSTEEEGGICWQPYSHWAFPDDDFEEGEPSYMMALKLPTHVSRKSASSVHRPVLNSLAVDVTEFKRPDSLRDVVSAAPPVLNKQPPVVAQAPEDSLQSLTSDTPPPPVPPKRPPAAFLLFCNSMRQRKASLLAGKSAGQASQILKDAYDLIPDREKRAYIQKAADLRAEYAKAKAMYDEKLKDYRKAYPPPPNSTAAVGLPPTTPAGRALSSSSHLTMDTQMAVSSPKMDLFNKVVRLKPGAPAADGGVLKHTYWYVLTYIPDLRWCHLAPMEAVGTFGPDKPKAAGRPKYKLVDESLGLEVDISSAFCIPVKARSMRKTMDADKEEWDVEGSDETILSRRLSLDTSSTSIRSAIKPSAVPKDRKRMRDSTSEPTLEAVRPDNGKSVHVVVRHGDQRQPPKHKISHNGSSNNQYRPPIRKLNLAVAASASATSSTESLDDDDDADDAESTEEFVASSSVCSTNSIGTASLSDRSRNQSRPKRPKRLSAPSFLGESPISPRIRHQSPRGRYPSRY